MVYRILLGAIVLALAVPFSGTQIQSQEIPPSYLQDPFRQLDELLPTPSDYRATSGAPGPRYWQQRADYDIKVRLLEDRHALIGEEAITYHNRAPLALSYLWVQLDQNRFEPDSTDVTTRTTPNLGQFTYKQLRELLIRKEFEGGHQITKVTDGEGEPLAHAIVDTMLRIDLPEPLEPDEHTVFSIGWT